LTILNDRSKKGVGKRNNGGQRDSQLRFYYIILRVVCVI
jgi:hypothetical protein